MKIEAVGAANMPLELQKDWRRIQQSRPLLAGPCFHPRLFLSIAQHVPGVKIAVLTRDSGSRAYLPYFQREGERIARSVPACDYQSIVAGADEPWDMRAILRGLNLAAWNFDNLISIASAVPPDFARHGRSPRVVLDHGMDAYLEGQRQAGKSGRNLRTHRRLLQRDHGPLRFVAQETDLSVLDALVRWKSDRFKGFADWADRTIRLIHSRPDTEFGGFLSALFAGDTLVAAHFGLRCDGILHYWFPGFNPEFSRYSPSSLLMEDLIAQLPSLNCHTLDLGPGGERYKDYFANAAIDVYAGEYELPSLQSYGRRIKRGLRNFVASSPILYRASAPVARFLRKAAGTDTREK